MLFYYVSLIFIIIDKILLFIGFIVLITNHFGGPNFFTKKKPKKFFKACFLCALFGLMFFIFGLALQGKL